MDCSNQIFKEKIVWFLFLRCENFHYRNQNQTVLCCFRLVIVIEDFNFLLSDKKKKFLFYCDFFSIIVTWYTNKIKENDCMVS